MTARRNIRQRFNSITCMAVVLGIVVAWPALAGAQPNEPTSGTSVYVSIIPDIPWSDSPEESKNELRETPVQSDVEPSTVHQQNLTPTSPGEAQTASEDSQRPAWLDSQTTRPPDLNLDHLVKKVFASLVLVLAGCFGVVLLMKKTGWRNYTANSEQKKSMKIIESIKVGSRSSLQLVEIDDVRYVVGVNSTGINSIVANHSFSDHLDYQSAEPAE